MIFRRGQKEDKSEIKSLMSFPFFGGGGGVPNTFWGYNTKYSLIYSKYYEHTFWRARKTNFTNTMDIDDNNCLIQRDAISSPWRERRGKKRYRQNTHTRQLWHLHWKVWERKRESGLISLPCQPEDNLTIISNYYLGGKSYQSENQHQLWKNAAPKRVTLPFPGLFVF